MGAASCGARVTPIRAAKDPQATPLRMRWPGSGIPRLVSPAVPAKAAQRQFQTLRLQEEGGRMDASCLWNQGTAGTKKRGQDGQSPAETPATPERLLATRPELPAARGKIRIKLKLTLDIRGLGERLVQFSSTACRK